MNQLWDQDSLWDAVNPNDRLNPAKSDSNQMLGGFLSHVFALEMNLTDNNIIHRQ